MCCGLSFLGTVAHPSTGTSVQCEYGVGSEEEELMPGALFRLVTHSRGPAGGVSVDTCCPRRLEHTPCGQCPIFRRAQTRPRGLSLSLQTAPCRALSGKVLSRPPGNAVLSPWGWPPATTFILQVLVRGLRLFLTKLMAFCRLEKSLKTQWGRILRVVS